MSEGKRKAKAVVADGDDYVDSEPLKLSKAQKKAKKSMESSVITEQMDELKATKAEQAEARLRFLLTQGSIFSHFGSKTKALAEKASKEKEKNASTFKSKRGANIKEEVVVENSPTRNRRDFKHDNGLDEEDQEAIDELEGGGPNTFALTAQPSIITGGTLRNYQLEGLNWVVHLIGNGLNGILADEMGLGKTLQSISVLAYMRQFQKVNGPHLIMVPKSTLSNWMNEFQRFCPSIRVFRFHGSKAEREEMVTNRMCTGSYQEDRDWDVCVTTYEVVNMEKNHLMKIAWRFLIIDEAHRLKNEASNFSKIVRLLTTQHRLLLTGTPLQNNLHELWALLNFLLPDVFSSSEQFDEWFNLDVDDKEAKERIISQLHKLLRPFMLRRLKADVEKTLPPKSETILFTGMSEAQKAIYKNILLRDIDILNSSGLTSTTKQDSAGSRTAILNIVMQLRKCCNHPYLFPGVEDRALNPLGDHLFTSCGKMVLLNKLLRKMFEKGHRVLLFSQMTRMLDILEDFMISQKYAYCRIDGNTTHAEREDRIANFNEPGSDKFCFLLSTRAGGLGINLQTADTVILYDSDWNPQADLQAQDRAHRIGQKKQVQVFRLVTDDTVEVKVVERAQQKLKLDAMVVQQGRLQDKEKKMSKNDLLDTLRFGADKVFRSKESTISDADIDLILEEGRKKTEELNSKLQSAEKGDMYDFSLDGGMKSQEFQGVDYSDKNNQRNTDFSDIALMGFIDPGKRERKTIINYAENIAHLIDDDGNVGGSNKPMGGPKLPRHMKIPKLEFYHLFLERERLDEIHELEVSRFMELVDKDELPGPKQGGLHKLQVLSPEMMEEKQKLVDSAFNDWTKSHYNNFVRATSKYGRYSYPQIALEVGKSVSDVKKYSEVFWTKGEQALGKDEWVRVLNNIERGERRLDDIHKLTQATTRLVNQCADPWEDLLFRNIGGTGARQFTTEEDRFLLCLCHLYGHGAWENIRAAVRNSERFRFDYFLQSVPEDILGRRCEGLMRSALRELNDRDYRLAMAAPIGSSTSNGGGGNGTIGEDNGIEKSSSLSFCDNQSSVDSDGKATAQQNTASTLPPTAPSNTKPLIDLRKLCQLSTNVRNATMEVATNHITAFHKQNLPTIDPDEKPLLITYDNSTALASANKNLENQEYLNAMDLNVAQTTILSDVQTIKSGRHIVKLVPNELLPRLCKLLVESKTLGVAIVTKKFLEWYPTISKRQVELKIAELAVKEKTFEDVTKVWHIRPEYQYMLKYDTPDEILDDSRPTFNKSVYALDAEMVLENGFSLKSQVKKDVKQEGDAEDKKAADKIKKKCIKRTAFTWFCLDKYEGLRATNKSEEELKIALIRLYDQLTPEQRVKYEEKAKAKNEE